MENQPMISDKMNGKFQNILAFLVATLLILASIYLIYTDLKKERKPTACEINSSSEDCYMETKNNEYNAEDDYQPGAYGPE